MIAILADFQDLSLTPPCSLHSSYSILTVEVSLRLTVDCM